VEIDLKVRQLGNDVHAIYEMLGTISDTQTTHGNQLRAVQKSLATTTSHLIRHDAQFDEVTERFNQVDERFSHIDGRFEQVDRRFDEMGRKLDAILAAVRRPGEAAD
jgi:hypothetical protein